MVAIDVADTPPRHRESSILEAAPNNFLLHPLQAITLTTL
jgi:hypothetical protein